MLVSTVTRKLRQGRGSLLFILDILTNAYFLMNMHDFKDNSYNDNFKDLSFNYR